MRDFSRALRGMVFWYDIDPSVDKFKVPTKWVNGRNYQSKLEYGRRPWVVVSSDDFNRSSNLVSIVPLTSLDDTSSEYIMSSKSHVQYTCGSKGSAVLCEQIRTIDSIELGDYIYTLSPEIMNDIDDALSHHLGMGRKVVYTDIGLDSSLKDIEKVVESIILEKFNSVRKEVTEQDLDGATRRLATKITNLFTLEEEPSKEVVKVESGLERFNRRYKNYSGFSDNSEEVCSSNSKNYKNRWDIDKAKQFISDYKCVDVSISREDFLFKWGLKSIRSASSTRYILKNKFGVR